MVKNFGHLFFSLFTLNIFFMALFILLPFISVSLQVENLKMDMCVPMALQLIFDQLGVHSNKVFNV